MRGGWQFAADAPQSFFVLKVGCSDVVLGCFGAKNKKYYKKYEKFCEKICRIKKMQYLCTAIER